MESNAIDLVSKSLPVGKYGNFNYTGLGAA